MSENLAELQVQLQLQTASFEKGVKDMDRQLKRMEKNTNRTNKSMAGLQKQLSKVGKGFIAAAAAAAAAFTVQQAKQAIEYADSIAKVADKVGVTTEQLQQLRFASEQSGVSTRTLDMALQRFARRTGEVAAGSGELLKTWKELGLEIRDQEGNIKPLNDLLSEYADKIQNAGSQQEKLRLAFKAFDSEGAALVNLLDQGAEGLEEFKKQANELGIVLSDDTTRAAEVLNDKLNILSSQAMTAIRSTFIDATVAALNFFGVFTEYDEAAQELDELNKKIKAYGEESRKIFEEDGNITGWRKKTLQNLLDQRDALEEQVEGLKSYQTAVKQTAEAEDQLASPETLARYKQLQKEVDALVDPAVVFEQKLKDIKQAAVDFITTSGEIGLSMEDAAALTAKITLEWYRATDAAVIYAEKVDAVLKEASFDDYAAQLGVLTAAMQAAEDAGNFGVADAIFDMIADLELGAEKTKDLGETVLSVGEEIKKAIDGFASDFTDSLVDGLLEGELAFEDFAKNVLATIAKMMLNRVFTQFFDTILGSFGLGGTGATASPAAVSPDVTMSREGGEQNGVMVTGYSSAGMLTSASNSPVTVNVMNYGNDEVEVNQRKTSRGIDIEVMIKKAVGQGIAGGDFDNVMRSSFGTRRLAY